jgi:hypothetical protein
MVAGVWGSMPAKWAMRYFAILVSKNISGAQGIMQGRFVNDYRGVPGHEKPNTIFVDARAPTGELKMTVQSSRPIKKGEEILVSYGKAWWSART